MTQAVKAAIIATCGTMHEFRAKSKTEQRAIRSQVNKNLKAKDKKAANNVRKDVDKAMGITRASNNTNTLTGQAIKTATKDMAGETKSALQRADEWLAAKIDPCIDIEEDTVVVTD